MIGFINVLLLALNLLGISLAVAAYMRLYKPKRPAAFDDVPPAVVNHTPAPPRPDVNLFIY